MKAPDREHAIALERRTLRVIGAYNDFEGGFTHAKACPRFVPSVYLPDPRPPCTCGLEEFLAALDQMSCPEEYER